jgi:hypothetical protein
VVDGQLNACDLSMSDIKKICKSFASTIRSMMHSRINYPKEEGSSKKAKKSGGYTEKKGDKSTVNEKAKA